MEGKTTGIAGVSNGQKGSKNMTSFPNIPDLAGLNSRQIVNNQIINTYLHLLQLWGMEKDNPLVYTFN